MDEDFFSDDATLDALPEDELQALEDAAVRGTQFAQSQVQPQRPQQKHKQQLQYQQYQYYYTRRTPASPRLPSQLPVGPPQQQQRARFQQRQTEYRQPTPSGYQQLPTLPYTNHQQNLPQQYQPAPLPPLVDNLPSSDDYGGFDEATELWDSVAPKAQVQEQPYIDRGDGEVGQVFDEYRDNQQYTNGASVYNDRVLVCGGEEMVGIEGEPDYYAGQQLLQQRGLQQESIHMKELKEMIEQLQSERETLQQDLRDARNITTSKTGEIAVVRSSITRSEREHQRIVASLANLQREEREKHKREIEAIKAESERMKTETAFLRKEIEEVAKQNRSLANKSKRQQQVLSTGAGEDGMDFSISTVSGISAKSPATTPKRNRRSFALRDGFEDEEMTSPSKAGNRTPKGVKRKRSILDSPIQVLPSRRITPVNDKPIQIVDEALLEKLWKDDDRFDFFKAVMAHRTEPGGERTLEALTRFSFISSPKTTLSTFFQDKVTLLQSTAAKTEFSAGVCGVLLSVWSRCLQEKLYGALYLVLGLLQFSIVWDQGSTCHHFFEEAVDLIQLTIDINAIPMLKRDLGKLERDVDVDVCLRLLEGITLGLTGDERNSKRLWKRIRLDFPLMMLNANQPLRHIKLMVSILSTSCLGDSFGPLSSNESEQRVNEGHLLDTSTKLLADAPKPMPNEPKYIRVQVVELQREVLQFLGGVAGMELGVLSLARNQNVLPRLAKRIAEELEEVYEFKSGRDQSIQFLNSAVRLLHGILTTYPSECAPKLAGSNTSHKHLVAMTRLAFSEGSIQEIGIEEDVIDCAYGLLESMVTPNEAESLWALFHPQ